MSLRVFATGILLTMLAACTGPIETRISNSGAGLSVPVSILIEAPSSNPVTASARQAVLTALADRGFATSEQGELQLQVGLSERDASIAVSETSKTGSKSLAGIKKRKPFQNCADREYRLTVVLTRISDGALQYRGSAAEYHCNAGLPDVLPALTKQALADIARPKGDYVITRSGID
ncbi:MAG: hypothetical protein ACRCY3_00565 [Sphingorhabdus sp.]